jgi:hypothetical protein
MKLIVDLAYQDGISGMRARISDTAEWGDYVSGPRVIGEASRQAMKDVLSEIQSGEFARSWIQESDGDAPEFTGCKAEGRDHRDRGSRHAAPGPDGLAQGRRGGRMSASFPEEDGWIWRNGEFIPWKDAHIHVMSHVVHYGSSVFEGIRCYRTPEGPAVLRLQDHLRRFTDSARIYRMDAGIQGRARSRSASS